MKSFNSQLQKIKELNEDFEWYPTTNEILEKLVENIHKSVEHKWYRNKSFLDIGAGNGKVLDFIKDETEYFSKFFFIEKSQYHNSNMNPSYLLLGSDFHKTTLVDKNPDIIFCNPPYSEYKEWSCKIIKEMPVNAILYLVIPKRWKNNEEIKFAINHRGVEVEIIDSFSFENSEDREARANVDFIKIKVHSSRKEDSPFFLFFEETFNYPEPKKQFEESEQKNDDIVHGENLIERLCTIYDNNLERLRSNYQKICELDFDLLQEFSISKPSLVNSLEAKIEGLKKQLWKDFFDGMDGINTRLTSKSRKDMLHLLNGQNGIDFNRENCYNILFWAVKNANLYFEKQFIEIYDDIIDYCNVENYKSNERVFQEHGFRYHYRDSEEGKGNVSHIKLKVGHRIVCNRCGGLRRGRLYYKEGLSEQASTFIGDLLTIAQNLGFKILSERPVPFEWNDSQVRIYYCEIDGEKQILFKVRAFLNSNMHFQFLPEFIHALNIQHGKLRGWINSEQDVKEEILNDKDLKEETPEYLQKIVAYFDKTLRIEPNQLLLK